MKIKVPFVDFDKIRCPNCHVPLMEQDLGSVVVAGVDGHVFRFYHADMTVRCRRCGMETSIQVRHSAQAEMDLTQST